MGTRNYSIIVCFLLLLCIFPVSEPMLLTNELVNDLINQETVFQDGTEYWALLVGVGVYQDNPRQDLPLTFGGVAELYETLLVSEWWDEDHIRILTGKNVTVLNIIRGLLWLDAMDDEDDICLLQFNMHGTSANDLPPFDEDDTRDEYITTYRSFKYDYPFMYIRDDQLNFFLSRLDAAGVCVIMDSCYSGGFNDAPYKKIIYQAKVDSNYISNATLCSQEGFAGDIRGDGRVILMSSRENETAIHGFTQFITQGLKGYADSNADGLCSAEELFEYAKPRIINHPYYTTPSTVPTIYDGYPGELVLTEVKLPPSLPATPSGPEIGVTNVDYSYSTSLTIPEGDRIFYSFDWGDGTVSDWLGPYNPGETCVAVHSWKWEGTYNIVVRAQNEVGAMSNWSAQRLAVTITSESNIDQRQAEAEFIWNSWGLMLLNPWAYHIYANSWVAQAFQPTTATLSKVDIELNAWRPFDPVIVTIRDDLKGDDLTEVSLIPATTQTCYLQTKWITFDFSDIAVTPHQTYYVLLKSNSEFHYRTGIQSVSDDSYLLGSIYFSQNQGESWQKRSGDFGFVTYE